jgi:hypothetical protein
MNLSLVHHSAYSDMRGMFVHATETQNIRLIARTQPMKKEARIIVGSQTDKPRQVSVKLTNMKPSLSLVTAKRICNTGNQPFESPQAMLETLSKQVLGTYIIHLGELAAWEAAELVIKIED